MKILFDDSKFSMWRAIMGVLHLDGHVSTKEMAWAMERINALSFTPEQKKILQKDLEMAPDIEEILPHITRPADRAFLLHMIRTLGHMDGDFSAHEKKAFATLEAVILNKINLTELSKEIEAMEHASYHENEVLKVHNKKSMFESMAKAFLKWANPGEHKFPNKS